MTTAAKVFAVLNVVLAIVFAVASGPIVKYRVDMRKKIKAEQDKMPGLLENVSKTDEERRGLIDQVRLAEGRTSFERYFKNKQEQEVNAQQALAVDQLSDAKEKLKLWASSLNNVESEITARTDEISVLDDQRDQKTAELSKVNKIVADLEERWEQAQQGIAAGRQTIEDLFAKLLRREPARPRNSTERSLTSNP